MEKTALILHGWGGKSEENWFPWLKKQLEKKTFEVYVPNMPHSQTPILEEQLEYISVYSGEFSEGAYIIAHSLGSQVALKFIEENNIKDSKIILVSPSYKGLADDMFEFLGENFPILEKAFDTEIDFEKINTLNNEFIVFLSDDDPYIRMEKARKYYKNLGNITFVEVKGKGHFNEGAGILELEEILEYLI